MTHGLYDPGKIESTFIEIICSKSTNVIVGCIYKHPTLPINDFTNDFISDCMFLSCHVRVSEWIHAL